MKKIRINGPIINDDDVWIYEWLDIGHASPSGINKVIDGIEGEGGKDLLVVINSGGGSVYAASEIYYSLKKYGENHDVRVEIAGMAASAASVIAMSGSHVSISPTGQMMIHNASMGNHGDYRDMDNASDFLKKVNESIMNAYVNRTGLQEDELKQMMDDETYMTAQEAVEKGFADDILFESDKTSNIVASNQSTQLLPASVIEEMKKKLVSGEITLNNEVNIPPIKETNNNEGDECMDKEKLKNEHPELYEEIYNAGHKDGVQAEGLRIKEIEDLAMPGNEELIQQAKFEEKIEAKDLAIQIIKAEKKKGLNFMNQSKDDAEEVNSVGASEGVAGQGNDNSETEARINEFTNLFNGLNGGIK